jgi:hypothetical protein
LSIISSSTAAAIGTAVPVVKSPMRRRVVRRASRMAARALE